METYKNQISEPVECEYIPQGQANRLAIAQPVETSKDQDDAVLRFKRNGRARFLAAITNALNTEAPDCSCLLRAI
jgi:hypothetical protein